MYRPVLCKKLWCSKSCGKWGHFKFPHRITSVSMRIYTATLTQLRDLMFFDNCFIFYMASKQKIIWFPNTFRNKCYTFVSLETNEYMNYECPFTCIFGMCMSDTCFKIICVTVIICINVFFWNYRIHKI